MVKICVKDKIINHLLVHGKKATSEKVLLKSVKELQKYSKKQTKELVKSSIILTMPLFKIHTLTQKKRKKKKVKEIPAFIYKKSSKISLAIKIIIKATKKKRSYYTHRKLYDELMLNIQNKGDSVELKDSLQQQVIDKKHLLKYYRWR